MELEYGRRFGLIRAQHSHTRARMAYMHRITCIRINVRQLCWLHACLRVIWSWMLVAFGFASPAFLCVLGCVLWRWIRLRCLAAFHLHTSSVERHDGPNVYVERPVYYTGLQPTWSRHVQLCTHTHSRATSAQIQRSYQRWTSNKYKYHIRVCARSSVACASETNRCWFLAVNIISPPLFFVRI